eukprot:6738633-Prorocentrum_lima.AAC.1
MPPLPQPCTPARMSAPGASSRAPGCLGFSPARTIPQCSLGDGHQGWDPGQRPPWSTAFIQRTSEQWVVEMTWKISTWGAQ